ncbi:transposase [Massilia sp. CCM 8693]|uniref:Transposase n=1 Tax=Massilia aquatica TaxID=2609000 RepID=A0ABX0MN00_9BURK|nr:transposase [Massilia aquatica]
MTGTENYVQTVETRRLPQGKASVHLKAAFMASHQSYGSRRLVTAMSNEGFRIGRFKVRSLMRKAAFETGLEAQIRSHDRQQTRLADCRQCAQPAVQSRGAGPGLRQRYHIRSHRRGMVAPGYRAGPVCSHGGLGHGAEYACQAGLRRVEHGHSKA